MKNYVRIITRYITIALFVTILCIFIAKNVVKITFVPKPTHYDGDIESIHYNREDNTLRLGFAKEHPRVFYLDPDSLEIQTFEIQRTGMLGYIRFFSPTFYEAYGQKSPGVVILTRTNPAELRADPLNKIAVDFPIAEQPTTADLSFVLIHNYFESHNKVGAERPLCRADNANGILLGLASNSCYIACQGKSEVMAKFLASSTRIVHLWSRREKLDGGYIFLWSELHTTLEIHDNGKWYVADPSYGFAYVKAVTGLRLDTKELIKYLVQQKSNELTFGLVHDGLIHDVPGDLMITENTSLPDYYYTPDKRLEYKPIRDEPKFQE